MFAKFPFRFTASVLAAALFLSTDQPPAQACGPWFSRQYLAQGGTSLLETPCFFVEIELALLARDFPVPFRAVHDEFPARRARERDLEDYEAAIRSGAIRPPDPEAARQAHRRMREAIRQFAELSENERDKLAADAMDGVRKAAFPSEFADYHEGLLAYSLGKHTAARAAWERLLQRPEAERRYRSVQAAFMIGVLGIVENWDDAPRWFALTRELSRRGFHDEAGLAAASYRRESEWHFARGDLRAWAENTLRSISAGYKGAYPSEFAPVEPAVETPEALAKYAKDPLLRNIQTIVLLVEQSHPYRLAQPDKKRLEAWLAALKAAEVRDFAGAERVAWLCYAHANYEGARQWLARAPKDSPRSLWLAGKLAAREGRREDSLRAFSAATRILARNPDPPLGKNDLREDDTTPTQVVAADHGIAAISADDFRQALDAFLKGEHWVDAAYVAERLMTIGELKRFVARRPWEDAWTNPPTPGADEESERLAEESTQRQQTANLRWLLARRLVREGRHAEARPFFPAKWRVTLDRYTQALSRGRNPRLSDETRALALWTAALEARHHGIELLGTEVAPDWFIHNGEFQEEDAAPIRLGKMPLLDNSYGSERKILPLPAILRASATERERLDASTVSPSQRFHYRYIAAGLGWKAASLLPGSDPRTASMLNLAGRWLAARDPDAADRFYQALESRCTETSLGQQAAARHWFVEATDSAVPHWPEAVPVGEP